MSAVRKRSSWTDKRPASPALLVPEHVDGLAVHWDGPPVGRGVLAGDPDAVATFLRSVLRFHTVTRGWSDIAYQWAVDNAGTRWELRGWRRQSAANGDQAVNRRFGAVLAIVGQGQLATPELLDGLRAAVVDFRSVYPSATRIVTHNDVRPDPTACPGPQLTRLVHGGQLDPRRHPPAGPKIRTEEGDEMVIVKGPQGAYYHLAGGKLIRLTHQVAASTAGQPRTIVETDAETWKLYREALTVVH